MNTTTHSIFTLLHYSILLRDTLEYCTNKPEGAYNVDMYKQRKLVLLDMLDKPSQLSEFLKNNGETGKKIDGQLREFIDDIYGDESTVLRLGAEGLRVDQSQHIKVYNYVIGLHETLVDIIRGFIKFANDNGDQIDDVLVKAFDVNNRFYRGLAYMILVTDLSKTFKEFNEAMKETKGQPSPQSNFITNDIQQIVSFLAFVRQHSTYDHGQPNEDRELCDIFDRTEEIIKKMNGTTPIAEGENIFAQLDDHIKYITSYVAIKEKENMTSLQALFAAANEFETKARDEMLKANAEKAE